MKEERKMIFDKYDGRCAYCGCSLNGKRWHVDHIQPIYRDWKDELMKKYKITRGTDCISNLAPACPRCNCHKNTHTLESFRHEIEMQVERTRKTVSGFRMAEDFGLVVATNKPVIFYFEKINNPL